MAGVKRGDLSQSEKGGRREGLNRQRADGALRGASWGRGSREQHGSWPLLLAHRRAVASRHLAGLGPSPVTPKPAGLRTISSLSLGGKFSSGRGSPSQLHRHLLALQVLNEHNE